VYNLDNTKAKNYITKGGYIIPIVDCKGDADFTPGVNFSGQTIKEFNNKNDVRTGWLWNTNGTINGLEPEVREHDPRLALSGGTDGLDAYRAIADHLPDLLAPGGIVGLEIGSDQSETVSGLYRRAGYEIEGPFADFGARPRALILRKDQA